MSESNHAEPKQDAVVEALVPDPTDLPPRVTMLRGFLGNSPADDQMRLYLTSSLDNYVTIHKTAILLIKELPDGQGTLVWVESGVPLEQTQTTSPEQVQAQFLVGWISDTNVYPPHRGMPPAAPTLFWFCGGR